MKAILAAAAFVLGAAAGPAMAESHAAPPGHLSLDDDNERARVNGYAATAAGAAAEYPAAFTPDVRLRMTAIGELRTSAGLKLRGDKYFLFGDSCEQAAAAPLAARIETVWNAMMADAQADGAGLFLVDGGTINYVSLTGAKPVGAFLADARGTRTDALAAVAGAMRNAACRKDDASLQALAARVDALQALLMPAPKQPGENQP